MGRQDGPSRRAKTEGGELTPTGQALENCDLETPDQWIPIGVCRCGIWSPIEAEVVRCLYASGCYDEAKLARCEDWMINSKGLTADGAE